MTLYIVRAKPKNDLSGLRKELELGNILKLRPFGQTLHYGLQNARFDTSNSYAMWVEEDYCSPPLAMERESVLDRYFDDITVDQVRSEDEGWNKIQDKPLLWIINVGNVGNVQTEIYTIDKTRQLEMKTF